MDFDKFPESLNKAYNNEKYTQLYNLEVDRLAKLFRETIFTKEIVDWIIPFFIDKYIEPSYRGSEILNIEKRILIMVFQEGIVIGESIDDYKFHPNINECSDRYFDFDHKRWRNLLGPTEQEALGREIARAIRNYFVTNSNKSYDTNISIMEEYFFLRHSDQHKAITLKITYSATNSNYSPKRPLY